MNVKENQKYQKTHQAIMDALMDALKEKTIKQVTVSELCRAVRINRSTFYEHFLDAYDVLEQIAETINEQALKNKPEDRPTPENFLALLAHIRDNKDFYRLYFRQGLPLNIQEKFFLSNVPMPSEEVLCARGIESAVQLEYHYVYFHAGIDAILKKWLERDCAETPEEVYEILRTEYRELPGV